MSILALGCLGAGGRQAAAAPSRGEILTFDQPDGTRVDVRLFGDEFYMRGEGLDGYTVVRDPKTRAICYAALNADSSGWVSTGEVYHGREAGGGVDASGSSLGPAFEFIAPSTRGIPPGLDLKPAARRLIRARATRELGLDMAANGTPDAPVGPSALGKATASAALAADSVRRVSGVIVLVEFPDVRATITQDQIADMANLKGFSVNGNNGSIRDYFLDVSHGKMEYNLDVSTYYMARNNKAYYDRDDGYAGAYELVKEALQGLDAKGYDFSKLTTTSSGTVVSVNVLFAGAAGAVWAQGLWAHRGNITPLTFDGVKVSGYMLAYVGTALTIGTFIHESGHLLFGWPDLYDYDSDSRGTGAYCLMSGQDPKNPQPPNAYLRVGQGWEPAVDLKTVTNGLVSVPSNGRANYRYANPANAKESYIIENIAKKGRWAKMPDDGLMIWHVDAAGDNSFQDRTASRHYEVSVVQADGKFDLEKDVNSGGANDLFHAGNNASFNGQTTPDSKWWNGSESGLGLLNISSVKDTMTFQIQGMAVGIASKTGGGPGGGAGILWRLDGKRIRPLSGPPARNPPKIRKSDLKDVPER